MAIYADQRVSGRVGAAGFHESSRFYATIAGALPIGSTSMTRFYACWNNLRSDSGNVFQFYNTVWLMSDVTSFGWAITLTGGVDAAAVIADGAGVIQGAFFPASTTVPSERKCFVVGSTYDNANLRLYLNGIQVAVTPAVGYTPPPAGSPHALGGDTLGDCTVPFLLGAHDASVFSAAAMLATSNQIIDAVEQGRNLGTAVGGPSLGLQGLWDARYGVGSPLWPDLNGTFSSLVREGDVERAHVPMRFG